MICDACGSDRVMSISAHSRDCCSIQFKGEAGDGYAPRVPYICGGDNVHPSICLECGKTQGQFPVADPDLTEM